MLSEFRFVLLSIGHRDAYAYLSVLFVLQLIVRHEQWPEAEVTHLTVYVRTTFSKATLSMSCVRTQLYLIACRCSHSTSKRIVSLFEP